MATAKKKARVIRAYTDRVDSKVHLKGEEVELNSDRLVELEQGGFVEPIAVRPAPKSKKGE